jgi:hypothetical protein
MKINYVELSNNLLSYLTELMRINELVEMLLGWEYTDDELIELGFDLDVIEQAKENFSDRY